jgi:hypothetical protein
MSRYVPDAASVAPLNRLGAEPDQVPSEPDGLQPDAYRSPFAISWRLSAVAFAAVIAFSMLLLLADLAKSADVQSCPQGQWLERYRNETAEQFLTTEVRLGRCTNSINYDWGTGSPGPGVNADNFTLRATRTLPFEAGDYEFRVTTDDGMRVRVDGVTIIDQWRPQSATTHTATRKLSAGSHRVVVHYYEAAVDAVAKVSWQRLSSPPPGSAACTDGSDNDSDKKIDLGDPGCSDASDTSETGDPAPVIPSAGNGGFVTGNSAANASTNRQRFLALSNTCTNVTLPPGDYYVDNGAETPWVEIQNYCGTFAFQEGARLHYLDPAAGGVRFRYGTGARFINWESYHPATVRGNPQDNFSLYNTTDSYIDSMFVDGGNVGIMPWLTTRSTIVNSHAQNTLADGLHIVASSGATVRNWSAYNTGDDGLSFQTYTEQYPVASGTADGVTVINGKTRGISVLGSQNITVRNFVVRNSWTSGLYVACEPQYNNCAAKPVRNVLYEHGKVYDTGRHPMGTGPNPDSITVWRSPNDNIKFDDIDSHTPLRDCYRGFDGGFATLTNVSGDGAGC